MSNLYMDKEYVIAGYVIGDEATNVFQAMITYDAVETSDSITYTFNVLEQTTKKRSINVQTIWYYNIRFRKHSSRSLTFRI